jgi:SAM-dependent methyltransferase
VGIVGLGTGALTAYGEPGETVVFYEIDPAVAMVARDPELFTYVADSRADVKVVLGDGRLRLSEEPSGRFDLLVIDAFSSDAIPVHLLTREALATFLDKLAPHGVIAYHISNRHLDLAPVVARLAVESGLATREQTWLGEGWVRHAQQPLGRPGARAGRPEPDRPQADLGDSDRRPGDQALDGRLLEPDRGAALGALI